MKKRILRPLPGMDLPFLILVLIVLIVVEFLPGRFQRTSVWRLSILFTAIQSIPAALPFGPLSALMNALPLSSLGFGWLLPALIGIGAGLLT